MATVKKGLTGQAQETTKDVKEEVDTACTKAMEKLHHRDSVRIESTYTDTMRNWINYRLKPRNMKLTELEHSLRDGVALGELVEVLTGQHVGFNRQPKSEFETLESIEDTLKTIQAQGIKCVLKEQERKKRLRRCLFDIWLWGEKGRGEGGRIRGVNLGRVRIW